MAVVSYKVEPLFIEPYFRANIAGTITQRQIDYIKNLKMFQNVSNLMSENHYIFEEPELKSIKDAVQDVLDIYARDVLGITQRLYVTQSWSLINPPNIGLHGHSHANSLISGSLYYCELPLPPSTLIFTRSDAHQAVQLVPEPHKRNIYNTPVNQVMPVQNEVLLFSSAVLHAVEHNRSNKPRYSIGFNCFVKGKLGDYMAASELHLNP